MIEAREAERFHIRLWVNSATNQWSHQTAHLPLGHFCTVKPTDCTLTFGPMRQIPLEANSTLLGQFRNESLKQIPHWPLTQFRDGLLNLAVIVVDNNSERIIHQHNLKLEHFCSAQLHECVWLHVFCCVFLSEKVRLFLSSQTLEHHAKLETLVLTIVDHLFDVKIYHWLCWTF